MNNEVENYGGSTETPKNEEPMKGWRKVLEQAGICWRSDDVKWLDDMRGNLGLIATIIATMTFQMALNPPGGVRSVKDDANPPGNNDAYANSTSDTIDSILSCDVQGSSNDTLCPGEAVLAVVYPGEYFQFLLWNTICFISSLTVLLVLVSGIRLNHRFPLWLLSIGMCLTLSSLGFTYWKAVLMVTPDPVWGAAHDQNKFMNTWIGLSCFLALFLPLRIIIWGVDYFKRKMGRNA